MALGCPLSRAWILAPTVRSSRCIPELPTGATYDENRALRAWEITSTGEVLDGGAVIHSRTVWALVEIRYGGPNYGTPRSVSVLRWEFR